jgi:hypothetical protein
MPLQLQRYWLAGKGAAKIRWNMPGDFLRCVRQLTKYFPKDPKGLCNILHTKATGGPPGHGSLEHALTASMVDGYEDLEALTAAQALLDRQPKMGKYAWAGPLAPIGRPTGEPRRTRIFEPGALSHRVLPLPLDSRFLQGDGHNGAMTTARILGITYGPDHKGLDFSWGWGDYLDEDIVPEARRARHLAEMGVSGPSVDPGGRVNATVNPETGFEHMLKFVIGGATMVSIPAFAALRQMVFTTDGDWPDDDPDMAMDMAMDMPMDKDCGCGDGAPVPVKATGYTSDEGDVFVVNASGWRGLPLAPRDAVFDNDDAVKRITAWANGGQDVEKMRRAFMYYDSTASPNDPTSYRLPLGDVINGRLTLIFHAIYAAAALISGAHGGLPNVPEPEVAKIRNVISDIYPEMATAFNDQSIRAPWDRSAQEGVQLSMDEYASDTAQPYGDVAYADPGYRDNKKRYPINTPEHIRAAWSYINQSDNASFYKPEQLKLIKARIMAAAKKHGVEISEGSMTASMTDDGYMLTPPREWFEDPHLPKGFKLSVDADGRVKGRLAEWGVCHRDVAMRECVLAPRSRQGYAPFHLGEVVTAEGDVLSVGKIVMDTRHADINLGYASAALHYDNTGDEVAVVRAGEDEYGIWVAGAVVPEATPRKVAKLRRSPLSGDWRREKGSLELTAALAVNAPAFPVYSIEGDEQLALVAAGSVWIEDMDEEFVPPSGIVEAITASVTAQLDEEDRDELAARLQDILEDEEIFEQRERSKRLEHMFAMDAAVAPAPAAPVAAPAPGVPAPGAVPTPGQVDTTQQQANDPQGLLNDQNIDDSEIEAWQMAAMGDSRMSIVAEPGAGTADQQPVATE